MAADLSYLIVSTNGGDLLATCVATVFDTAPEGLEIEVLVLDNASTDGSVEQLAASWGERIRTIRHDRRRGKAENDTELLEASTGPLALLLNEDVELLPGCVEALVEAIGSDPRAGAVGGRLLDPSGAPQPSAWRFPGLLTALASAAFLHRRLVVQSRGYERREVDWVQSAAMLVRREAFEEVGGLDERFFVYSDEVDWQKRMAGAGWKVLWEPRARAVHHEQLRTDRRFRSERIVEFHRNRDLYMQIHHGRLLRAVSRALTAWAYGLRALVSVLLPGRSPRRYLAHAAAALLPARGEGIREAAERFNEDREARGQSDASP